MKKVLSFMMSVLIISISVVGVFSAENKETINYDNHTDNYLNNYEHDYEKEIKEKKKTSLEFEVISLREEYVKHFAQADGTIKAVVYPFPIHKPNEQGGWDDLYCSGQTTELDCRREITEKTRNGISVNGYENYDTYISQSTPNSNYMFDDYLYVSSSQIAYYYCTNPEIPNNATVINASLTYRYWYNSNLTSGNAIIGIYEVLSEWDPFELTYSNSGVNNGLSSYQSTSEVLTISSTINSYAPGTAIFDITELALGWYAGKTNNGVGMKHIGGQLSTVIFCSNETYPLSPVYSVTYELDDLIAENGYYFIYNVQLERYLQIDPDATTPNQDQAYMEVWTLDGDDDQQWYIKYLHNGYYKITSRMSHKSLAIVNGGDNTNGARIVQESYSVSDRQQWSFSISPRGYVVIRPKSSNSYPNNDWVMTTAFGIFNGDGREVVQYVYSNNNDLKDEWVLTGTTDT